MAATDLGHGQPGLIDGLRPFSDLSGRGNGRRTPYLDLLLGAPTTTWTLASGVAPIYSATVSYVLGGVLRDVLGIDTAQGPLTRVENLADVVAGTYFADRDAAVVPALVHWDDGATTWDSGAPNTAWDTYPPLTVYLQMHDSSNPNNGSVVPVLGFHYGARGEVHPVLGVNKLSASGWTATGQWDDGVTHWDAASISWDAFTATVGASGAITLISTGGSTGSVGVYQDKATVAGKKYRLSGYYTTDSLFSANLSFRLLVGKNDGSAYLYRDGRDADSSGSMTLVTSHGERRRFLLDFIAPAATTRVLPQINAPVVGAGQVIIESLALQRVWSYELYESRLGEGSLGEASVAASNIMFGGKTVGQSDITILDGDGTQATIFAQLLTANRTAQAYVGGAFTEGGQEIYRDDWLAGWAGLTRNPTYDDFAVRFNLDDAMAPLMRRSIPVNELGLAEFPNIRLNDVGKPKPLVFSAGGVRIRPPRVDLTSNGYGVYQLADPAVDINGIGSIAGPSLIWPLTALVVPDSGILFYMREEDLVKDFWRNWLLAGTDYSVDTTALTFGVLTDVLPPLFDKTGTIRNVTCDFDIGGATLTASTVPLPGPAGAPQTAATLQANMRTVSGAGDIFVTHSESTHAYTVSKTAGILNLRSQSGPYAAIYGGWKILGFSASADYTGALTYTGGATFTAVDTDHLLAAMYAGYVDDASGTITGTPNAAICRRASIAHFILRQVLGVPSSRINAVSFQAGHAAEAAAYPGNGVFLCLRQKEQAEVVLANLCRGAFASLIVNNSGAFQWVPYSPSATAAATFSDRDYLTWQMWTDEKQIYSQVVMQYGNRPTRNDSWDSITVTADAAVSVKYGTTEPLKVTDYTAPGETVQATTIANRLARLAASAPRYVKFSTLVNMADRLIGDIITVTRVRGLDPSGALNAVRFRVTGLKRNLSTGVHTCIAVEDTSWY